MSFNSEWENIAVVGRGGSSTVYKAVLRPSGKFVAVKQIDIDGLSRDQIGGIKGEIETMKDLSHPNILCYLGTQQSPNRVFIFLEYADRGSLRQFYQSSGPLTEPQISFCLQGIVAGLNYLHDNGIAHRDIKCANCLLCSDGVVKLADFGASKRFEMDSIVSGLKGTPHWMAPEVIKGTQMTTGWIKADVWSLGCAVVEMFTAKVPYAEYENPMTAMYKIASGEIPSLKPSSVQPDAPSAALVSFIHACCAVDPTVRPGADALLSHAFIVEKVNDVGALFAEAAPIQTPALTGAAGQPTESEANVGCSTSAATAAQHHHRISPVEVPAEPVGGSRSRAGSMCSLVSGGGDDDETTVAHGAETSYTDDDFCSYGSTGQSDLNAQPLGLACNSWDKYASGAATPIAAVGPGIAIATGESQEPLIKDEGRTGRALAGGPPSGVRTSSRSRSRGHSRPMAINTAPAPSMSVGVGDLLDASTGGMEDLLTPALHKEAGRGASVQVQMMPMLGEQVRELTLSTLSERASSSTKGPYLVRKWSETAFLNASQDMCVEVKPDNNDFKNGETMPVCELTKDKVSAAGSVTHNSAPPSGVPTYEDANMVYKNMMMKYSPRAKDTGIIQKFKVADLDAQADVAASGADEIEDSVSDTDSLGSKVNDKSTSVVVSTVSAPPVDELPVNVLPLSLKHPSPAPVLEVVAAPDRAAPINDSSHSVPASNRQKLREHSQKVEPLKELKPIVREVKRQKPKDLRNPVFIHFSTVSLATSLRK